tara:strand:- start:2536 stop:2676 length:141 start_codon:yes stop_codon:yes gene_type:complete
MIEIMNEIHLFMAGNAKIIKIIFMVIGALCFINLINMDKKVKKDYS